MTENVKILKKSMLNRDNSTLTLAMNPWHPYKETEYNVTYTYCDM